MIRLGNTQPNQGENSWQQQLDQFVQTNQQELAALAWGLFLEQGDSEETLGIDLKPQPHFVSCPKESIERLNQQVGNQLQEILGLVDAHNPEQEVLILGIGDGQIKLIQFEPQPPPPECFEQVAEDVETLIDKLEQRLTQQLCAQ
jgi:hypothetical protein